MAGVRGGLMRVVETLAREQARVHEVRVLSPLPPPLGWPLPTCTWASAHLDGNSHLLQHRRLLRLLGAFGPDAVILHAGSPGELALASALLAPRSAVVVVEHAPEHYPRANLWRDYLWRAAKRRAARWLAVSEAGGRALTRAWRLPAGTIGVIHNGVDRPPEIPPEDAEVRALFVTQSVVLAAGAPDERKGFDTFRAVAARLAGELPDARFLWVGAKLRRKEGVVELLPWTDSLGWMLRRAACVLLPSRAEGLPLLLLEAWACGRAVVASSVGGIPEVVCDGRDALLLPADDVAAWRDRVAAVLGDEAAREALGRAGEASWRARFTAQAMVQRYQTVIGEAMEAARARRH